MQSKIVNRVLSVILSVSLIFQMGMPVVYAAEDNPIQETKTITVFAELPEDVKTITAPVGTAEIEVLTSLPETVTATVASAVYGETQPNIEDVPLFVTWESDKPFSSETADTFTYTAQLTDASYTIADSINLPQIKVQMDDSLNSAEGLDTAVDQTTGTLEAPAEHFTVHTAVRMLTSSNIAPTVDVGSKDIYANGTPITIEAGTLKDGVRNSRIKYNNGTNDVYLDLNPNEDGIQEEAYLSSYGIYGGSNPSNYYKVENTFITMTGGKVSNIYGGGYSPGVSGDTHINISGTAEVCGNIYGGGYGNAVKGTAYITITSGDISQEHCGMVAGGGAEWGTVGRTEIKITGGTVNQVMAIANPGGGSVTGEKTALITVPVGINDWEFTNAIYKKDTQWVVKGNVTLTDDLSITIAEDETMIVPNGSTLTTNGNLINNGTIIKKGTITGDVPGTGSIVLTPLVDDLNKAVYANGIPITILEGTSDNQSMISYGEGLYVDFNGNSSKDLTEYSIYGGSGSEEKLNSNIKMTGGSVINIYGQGKGFTVKDTTILVTGGTVSGTIEGGGENSTDNGYITVLSNGLKPETFDNLFYKEAESKWNIKGEYIISENDSFYLESNETLYIPQSATLIIRGEFTNKGIIINNGKIIGVAGGNIQGTGVILTEPVIDNSVKVIYANGTPIIIEKGSDSEHSRIKYYDGTGYVYLNMESSEDLLIKDYTINGGAKGADVRKTSITMNGGNIKLIEGGNATESVDIIVTGDVNIPIGRGGNISFNTNENTISNLYVYYKGTNPDYIPYPISDNISYGFKNIFCYYPNMPQAEDWKPEIIQGKAVIPKGYTVEIPQGKEMTFSRGSTLTIDGTLTNNGSLLVEGSISEESTGTLQGSGLFKTTVFTSDDIQAIPDQPYTGNAIMPAVTINPTRAFMSKVFTVDTSGYTKSYENNTNAGAASVVFTSANGAVVKKAFNIVKSSTIFDGGIKVYNGETPTNIFTYGDAITVKLAPKVTGMVSAPTDNKMKFYVSDNKIAEGNADENGVYTMTYDTKNKTLVSGENIITVKYQGNENVGDCSDTVNIVLNKKAITANVAENQSKVYDGMNGFTGVELTPIDIDSDTLTATARGTVTDVNVATDKAFTAMDVTLNGDHKDYYSLAATDVSGNVAITQATAAGVDQEMQAIKDLAKEYTFDLVKLLPALSDGKSFGDITYTVGTVTNSDNVLAQNPTDSDIADGKITLKVANLADKDKTATVQIKVASKNYKDFTAYLNVKTIDKTPLTVEAVFTGGTYNGNPYSYTGTPTFKNGTEAMSGIIFTAKYAGRDGTTYNESETAPKDAGKYNLILTISGESANTYAGTTSIYFEIAKKQITAKPNEVSIESNASFPASTWSIDTGIAGETITATNVKSVVMEAQENGTKLNTVKVGTFDIVFTTAPIFNQNGDTEKNYDIQMGKGKLTVTKHNSGGGSSGGGGSSSNDKEDSSTSVITLPATTDNPNSPTQATTTVASTIANGTANVTLSQSTVADAISKAQSEAKKNGTENNGIAVEIKVDTKNITASSLSANLPKATVDALVKAEVKEVRINSGVAKINLDLETLKAIQKEIGEDVNVSAKKVDNSTLSAEAKSVVGNRPVFDLSITGTNGTRVTDFGKGKVSVSIPYTLDANEKAENVAAYYIDENGKVQEIPNSVYDEESKTLTFVTDHFSKYAVGYKADKATAFTDIENHWAKEEIEFVTARGLFSGTGDGKFSPNMSMTRGMFVTVLGRLAEVNPGNYKNTKFTDVKAGNYYIPYIEWAYKNGIVKGTSEATFAPDQSVTREQIAVIMASYAKAIGSDLPQVHSENIFVDNGQIASYAKTAVKQMQMADILEGKNGNKFDPQGTVTRAEVSAVIKRFAELVINSGTSDGWMQN